MRSLAGTVEAAKDLYPEVYQQREEVRKMQQKVRRTLRQTTKQRIREEYYNSMPTAEVNKQIDQLLSNPDEYQSDSEEEDVIPLIPEYVFQERACIVDAFYGPDAETLEGEAALARRIQVTKDMVALCRLSEPSRRGKRPSSTMKDDSDDEPKQEADLNPSLDEMSCPTNICIVCQRKFPRIDSVRRHLISQHLNEQRKMILSLSHTLSSSSREMIDVGFVVLSFSSQLLSSSAALSPGGSAPRLASSCISTRLTVSLNVRS